STTPQCSRSVIGLIVPLTQALTLIMSAQALGLRTTSRGSEGAVAHSGWYSMQKSTQPIGARVTSPTTANAGCSDAPETSLWDGVVSPPAAVPADVTKAAALARSSALAIGRICLKRPGMWPFPLVGATFPTNHLYWR